MKINAVSLSLSQVTAQTSRSTLSPPPPRRRGLASANVAKEALGVEPLLRAKFQPCSTAVVGAYGVQTHCQMYIWQFMYV